jgi:hypothetical protein
MRAHALPRDVAPKAGEAEHAGGERARVKTEGVSGGRFAVADLTQAQGQRPERQSD